MYEIIQDYGKTVTPEIYMDTLQGHPYIPQADQVVRNIVKKFYFKNGSSVLLDLGCGPGRLTRSLKASCILGLDISETFIKHARLNESGVVSFGCADFAKDISGVETWNSGTRGFFSIEKALFDIILMQGVMHHVHGEDRAKFLRKSFDLLKPDGILIIGDEFIKDYESEDERVINVAKFYLHIIDEARKGGFDELAEEEAKNLIDDCFSGTKFAGHATEETFVCIYQYAQMFNEWFYTSGEIHRLNYNAISKIRDMFDYIKRSVESLVDSSAENFNRGDYKVSPNVFTEELSGYGFVLEEKYEIGPVKQLGGMGVLVFKKR